MKEFSISPREMFASAWRNRRLIWQMTRREVIGRYRGSMLGMIWSFFNPLLMLAVYTFVFGVVFKARWSGGPQGRGEYALALFAGMIIYGLFAECLARAPGLVLANPSYVKKVVFPLEILPWIALGASLFHAMISLGVLLLFSLLLGRSLPWTLLLLPLVLLPLLLLTLGSSWLLSSLGVYLRDVNQTMGLLVTVLMFVSPVFYPASALPERFRGLLQLNPLTPIIEHARGILLQGTPPPWAGLGATGVAGALFAWAGFVWFQKTRKGFADVL